MGCRVAAAAGPDARGHFGAVRSTAAVMAGERQLRVLGQLATGHSPSKGRSVTSGVVGTGVPSRPGGSLLERFAPGSLPNR